MSPTRKKLRLWWPLAITLATLFLSGCFNSDSDERGVADSSKGAQFHGAEWATIKNLDPRGEQCIDCHGKNADMAPFSGGVAHNIGLKNLDTAASLGVEGIEITKVVVNEETGDVTVTLNQAMPVGANFGLTFAKLAPRVIHNRGHDWQNYFASSDLAFGERRKAGQGIEMMLEGGGAQPLLVPDPVVSGNTITFNMGDGANRSWGEHSFTVKSAYEGDTDFYEYTDVLGTKVADTDLARHIYCDAAAQTTSVGRGEDAVVYNSGANQIAANNGELPVCWWPDGTHLPAGVFVTDQNELVVAYQEDYTHRLALIINGQPGHNVWYDFVPSVASGKKTASQLNPTSIDEDADGNPISPSMSVGFKAESYISSDGRVNPNAYKVAEGNAAPDSVGDGAITSTLHQQLPAARDVVDVQSCNSCHDSLSMHGGSRSQTQTCVTCHNPGNLQASSGRSMDFKVLIHRIHRGANLPSELADIKEHMGGDQTLLSTAATDFTKVRFPQGSRPGNPEGITNCVKCHMGTDTKELVQGLASELGSGADFKVQEELKLAKVTPQGDNWLAVRNVNACQACHDSNVWIANGSINGDNKYRTGNSADKDPADHGTYQLDKYMPFYGESYLDIGYKWLGKKHTKNQDAGWVHNTQVPSDGGRFTCGSGGGCHGNNSIDGLNVVNVGNPFVDTGRGFTNAIQDVHLRLTRDFIIAERFGIKVNNVSVDAAGFHVKAGLIDKKHGTPIVDPNNYSDPSLGNLSFTANAMFGWMANGSPDYNQSAGGGFGSSIDGVNSTSGGQPGAPAGLKALTFDSSGEGSLTITWDEINAASGNSYDFNKDFDKATSFGTVAINASLTADGKAYRLRSVNRDFSFATGMLAEGEVARRQVVDFSAGSGIDENRDRYAGWDKEHGANTQSCSSCHLKFDMHGPTVSNNTQMCVMCHNPNLTDIRARNDEGTVALGNDGQYEESEDFKRLIHAAHASGAGFRIDPLQTRANERPSPEGESVAGHSFPGVLSNCKACHIETEPGSNKWTFELDQLPEGLIGSTAITGDWAVAGFNPKGGQHNLDNHLKMSPIASVCSSCHDAGYKTGDGRMNENIIDGGPYVGSHWWVMGGIAPGVVPEGAAPKSTKHQSGK